MKYKFFVIGDLHLGKSLGRKKLLRKKLFDNLEIIKQDILRENPTMVFLLGDILDKDSIVNPDTNYYLNDFLVSISKLESIEKIILLAGNHDSQSIYFEESFLKAAEKISPKIETVIDSSKVITYKNIDFFLIPHNKKFLLEDEENQQLKFYTEIDKLLFDFSNEARKKVLMSHYSVDKWMPYSQLKYDELRVHHFDYIIFGDLHDINFNDGKFYYTGSIFPCNYKELKENEQGYRILTYNDDTNILEIETKKLPKPKYLVITEDKDIDSYKTMIDEYEFVIFFVSDIKTKKKVLSKIPNDKIADIQFFKMNTTLNDISTGLSNITSVVNLTDTIYEYVNNVGIENQQVIDLITDIATIEIDDAMSQTNVNQLVSDKLDKFLKVIQEGI